MISFCPAPDIFLCSCFLSGILAPFIRSGLDEGKGDGEEKRKQCKKDTTSLTCLEQTARKLSLVCVQKTVVVIEGNVADQHRF